MQINSRMVLALAATLITGCATTHLPAGTAATELPKVDIGALEALLADDLLYCHSSGNCESRAEFLDSLRSGRMRYRKLEILRLDTRREGRWKLIAWQSTRVPPPPSGTQTH